MSHRLMKAALHTDAYKLDIIDKAIPEITDYDHALLKVGAVGFCGSDKHDLETPPRAQQTPGHEFTGTIVELGSEPGEFQVGDRVLARPWAWCGQCDECEKKPRGHCQVPAVYGCRGSQNPPGAMAEYVLVRTLNLTKLPDDVSMEEASFVDPLATATHAINLGPEVRGKTCVVLGAGVIGLQLAQALKIKGAKRVAVVDVLPSHLDVARSLGDFDTLMGDDRDKLVTELINMQPDIYYELAGGESPTLDIAIHAAKKGAAIMLISQRPKGVWLNYQWVMGKELLLKGVSGHSDESWEQAVDLIFNHRINVKPLITHRYPLEQVQEALEMAVRGDSLKVILRPNGEVL